MTRRKQEAVRVRYVGNAKRRTVNEYEWNAENGYVQTVYGATLVERLAANGDFVVMNRAPDAEKNADDKEQAE